MLKLLPVLAIAALAATSPAIAKGYGDKGCEGDCGAPAPEPEPEPSPEPEPEPEPDHGDRSEPDGDMPHGLDGQPKLGDSLCRLLGVFCNE